MKVCLPEGFNPDGVDPGTMVVSCGRIGKTATEYEAARVLLSAGRKVRIMYTEGGKVKHTDIGSAEELKNFYFPTDARSDSQKKHGI